MTDPGEQMALVRAEAARGRVRAAGPGTSAQPAESEPVARVIVDVEPAHLDRLWDYTVPAKLHETARPGVRVRVRFAGQLVDGYLWERVEKTDFSGRLTPLHSVVSPEPVLTREIGELARRVADAYAGTAADVLRLAIPPRHARTEKALRDKALPDKSGDPPDMARTSDAAPPPTPDPRPWKHYPHGPDLLTALAQGQSPRAVWAALPGADTPEIDWAHALAAAAQATLHSGRGALIVVPDGRDVARVDAALIELLGPDRHVALTADLGPAERYGRWLAVRRGEVRCVVGTRAAVFAPITNLGLVALWDDGDSSLAERAAPYSHAREVLTMRAHQTGAAALIGGYTVTAEGAQLVARRWARPLTAPRAVVRELVPLIRTVDPDRDNARDSGAARARMPTVAWRVARDGLRYGPVLVQVPRSGYLPALACVRCREAAHCAHCHGALALAGAESAARCRWCGRFAEQWRCDRCGATRFRARATGAARSAEELGRAFPGVPVRLSRGGAILTDVSREPALVVATPGAEPVAEGGYAAAVLLDGDLLLGVPMLRAAEQTLRRWLGAAALVRPASRSGQEPGGVVAVVAEPGAGAVQALVRWDPGGFARRELADRAELGYPPAARIAELAAPYPALAELLEAVHGVQAQGVPLPQDADILGPTPLAAGRDADGPDAAYRALIRCSRTGGRALAEALKAAQGARSTRKAPVHVRVRIDPVDLA
ncbi:MAG TPA: primosomal protein N' [Actinocrinis sp.]|nr:primosomal protein N' [Actinocrinis sp.]HEV3169015.1 primosomal protein N' [Actinocrinis sp.]